MPKKSAASSETMAHAGGRPPAADVVIDVVAETSVVKQEDTPSVPHTVSAVYSQPIDNLGRGIEWVNVEIDYAIIEHFSKHLYGSPNKAIEELVVNSFDASALKAFVYIPGTFTDDAVLIWDDGNSMNTSELHQLWWIAQSPKNAVGRQAHVVDESGQRQTRAMIGKFGIGKLASCVVGDRITHLCRQGERFLRITINYRDVPHLRPEEQRKPYAAQVIQLSEEEARQYAESLFRGNLFSDEVKPRAFTALWDSEHWTLAVIDQIKPEISLSPGRLSWVIGNSMPLRPDFRVWVNDQEVTAKLEKGATTSWDLSSAKLQQQFAVDWQRARSAGDVNGDYTFVPAAKSATGDPGLELPELGFVRARLYLFKTSLLEPAEPDAIRSYGFFLMVRDRLINVEDEKGLLGLTDPQYGTFYRCQFVIRADGLDLDLLADRERFQTETPRVKELSVLRDAMYHAARQELTRQDAISESERQDESFLPIESRDFFREPLTALLMRNQDAQPMSFDPEVVGHIELSPLDSDDPVATVDFTKGGFIVNSSHPLRSAVEAKIGGGRQARELLRALDLYAVSERLFEGFLYDLGLPDEQINRILIWRDGLLRTIARHYTNMPLETVIVEVRNASHRGKKEFEDALAKLFALLGFATERDGASGKKDVLVVAPIGPGHYTFTVEAKGSKNALENDAVEVSAAAAHRDAVKAKHAVIVAREFKGFEREPKGCPAVLKECESTGAVSIVTVDTLVALCEAMRSYYYPLDSMLEVLSVIESPEEKLERVQRLQQPTSGFDYRGVLDAIWNFQQGESHGDLVSRRRLWQSGPDRWGIQEFEEFEQRLIALETLSDRLVQCIKPAEVIMHQNPEIVVQCIQQAVALRASQVSVVSNDA